VGADPRGGGAGGTGSGPVFAAVEMALGGDPGVVGLLAALDRRVPELAAVDPGGLHVTLHFFGRLAPADEERARRAVRACAERARPFRLRLGGGGAFPDWERPTALWLGVEDGSGGLGALHRTLGRTLETAGLAADRRPYRPHCTVARVRRPLPQAVRDRLRDGLAASAHPVHPVAVSTLHLLRSVARPGRPAVYLSLLAAPLTGPGPTDGP